MGSAAVFMLASLITSGEPTGPAGAGWAAVALQGSVFTPPGLYDDRVVLEESADAASRQVTYRLAICNPDDKAAAPVQEAGLFLLHGRAMLSTTSRIEETVPYRKVGSLVLSRLEVVRPVALGALGAVLSYHLDGFQGQGSIPLTPGLQVFHFSEAVWDCDQYSEFASVTDPAFGFDFELTGVLGEGLSSRFAEGPFQGPHDVVSWPEVGTPYYDLLARANFTSVTVNGARAAYEFPESMAHSTFEVTGGAVGPNDLVEELLPSSTDPPQLDFSSVQPIAPVLRLDDIATQQRWAFVETFAGILFGIAAGLAATYLFEALRKVGDLGTPSPDGTASLGRKALEREIADAVTSPERAGEGS
jgi:hypothetical protein